MNRKIIEEAQKKTDKFLAEHPEVPVIAVPVPEPLRTSLWQPISTAPKDGKKILVYTVHGEIEISEWFETVMPTFDPVEGTELYAKRMEKLHDGWNSNSFDWWMPLPEPPAGFVEDAQAEGAPQGEDNAK